MMAELEFRDTNIFFYERTHYAVSNRHFCYAGGYVRPSETGFSVGVAWFGYDNLMVYF